jgi:hypothetical protein
VVAVSFLHLSDASSELAYALVARCCENGASFTSLYLVRTHVGSVCVITVLLWIVGWVDAGSERGSIVPLMFSGSVLN